MFCVIICFMFFCLSEDYSFIHGCSPAFYSVLANILLLVYIC